MVDQACLCDQYIEARRAVVVAANDQPVAFVGGLAIGDIIDRVGQGCTFGAIREWLEVRLNAHTTAQVTGWLIRNDVVRVL